MASVEAQWIIEGRGARAGSYGPPLIHAYMASVNMILQNHKTNQMVTHLYLTQKNHSFMILQSDITFSVSY
jgi:hypothetical protein